MIATLWELWDDRKGDFNKSDDVLIRLCLFGIEACCLYVLFGIHILIAFNLSVAFFFLVFDYAIAYILIKNKTLEPRRGVTYHWFTYQAKDGVIDNIVEWRNINPKLKAAIRVAYFTLAIKLFL